MVDADDGEAWPITAELLKWPQRLVVGRVGVLLPGAWVAEPLQRVDHHELDLGIAVERVGNLVDAHQPARPIGGIHEPSGRQRCNAGLLELPAEPALVRFQVDHQGLTARHP